MSLRQYVALFAFLFFLPNSNAFASDGWICQEAASVKDGNEVLACGVGEGKNEADARIDALEKAKAEFNEICDQSVDCRGKETVVTPLRNTCEVLPNIVRCYRGIRYEIVQKRKITSFDPKITDIQVAQSKTVRDEKELSWRLMLGIGYSGDSTSYSSAPGYFGCGTFDAVLQHDLVWRFKIALRYSYKVGTTGNLTTTGNGTPNTSSNFTTSSHGNEFGLSVPFEFTDHWFLSPEAGHLTGALTSTAQNYGVSGQGTWSTATSTSSFQSYFVGGQLRYQSGLIVSEIGLGAYFYVGYKQYLGGNSTADGGAGLQFGF